MSAGTLSPTLMCTISPGTRFRARNVSSCPSRKLKTNWVHDMKWYITKLQSTSFIAILSTTGCPGYCRLSAHYAQVSDKRSLLISSRQVQKPPLKTEFNLCWTGQFHNTRSFLRYISLYCSYTALVNWLNYNKLQLSIFFKFHSLLFLGHHCLTFVQIIQWAPWPVQTLWKSEKSLTPAGYQTTNQISWKPSKNSQIILCVYADG